MVHGLLGKTVSYRLRGGEAEACAEAIAFPVEAFQPEAHRKKAEERFAHEKAQREKMYAEQDRLHAMRQKWADEMREIQKPNEKLLAMKKETNKNESHKEYD